MPKYLISYRKTEEAGQKPEWASFTTQSEASLEAHAIRERVEKRHERARRAALGRRRGRVGRRGRLDDVLYKREEAAPDVSIVYGLVEE